MLVDIYGDANLQLNVDSGVSSPCTLVTAGGNSQTRINIAGNLSDNARGCLDMYEYGKVYLYIDGEMTINTITPVTGPFFLSDSSTCYLKVDSIAFGTVESPTETYFWNFCSLTGESSLNCTIYGDVRIDTFDNIFGIFIEIGDGSNCILEIKGTVYTNNQLIYAGYAPPNTTIPIFQLELNTVVSTLPAEPLFLFEFLSDDYTGSYYINAKKIISTAGQIIQIFGTTSSTFVPDFHINCDYIDSNLGIFQTSDYANINITSVNLVGGSSSYVSENSRLKLVADSLDSDLIVDSTQYSTLMCQKWYVPGVDTYIYGSLILNDVIVIGQIQVYDFASINLKNCHMSNGLNPTLVPIFASASVTAIGSLCMPVAPGFGIDVYPLSDLHVDPDYELPY